MLVLSIHLDTFIDTCVPASSSAVNWCWAKDADAVRRGSASLPLCLPSGLMCRQRKTVYERKESGEGEARKKWEGRGDNGSATHVYMFVNTSDYDDDDDDDV